MLSLCWHIRTLHAINLLVLTIMKMAGTIRRQVMAVLAADQAQISLCGAADLPVMR